MPQSFDPVFENWYTEKQIGSGTDGKVYSIVRKNADGSEEHSVLKMIRLGENRSEKKSFNTIVEKDESDGSDESFFETVIKNITDNIAVIQKVDNGKRFVKYEQWETRRTSDGKGYAILIRLERARSLTDLLSEFSFTLDETLRIGVSICRSLARCRDFGYIYPNLKPENILFDEKGICKLGDFGSFSCLEPSKSSLAFKRTRYYMAPEFIATGNVNSTVDTYSLGLVLYSLINRGRLPFTEPYPQKVTVSSLDDSMKRRLSGEELPEPALCDEALFRIIKKACAYKIEERYLSPKQMLSDLKNALEKKPFEETVYDDVYSVSEKKEEAHVPPVPEKAALEPEIAPEKPQRAVSLREEIQIPNVTPMDYAGKEVKVRKKRPGNFETLPAARKKQPPVAASMRKTIILAVIALVLLVLFIASVAMKMRGDTGTTISQAVNAVSNTLMIYGGHLFYGV